MRKRLTASDLVGGIATSISTTFWKRKRKQVEAAKNPAASASLSESACKKESFEQLEYKLASVLPEKMCLTHMHHVSALLACFCSFWAADPNGDDAL